ncbi:MAG TPA: DotD/TraH family lipoprotein [Alphaproteobacteria bacterium]|nr:DotD/TraH family lipoprotein [Alphaproteobacteria bacterium]HNS45300.1 DotD/TraH family lipoprotein [Alphaproteobacteria bacterium]
MSHPVRLVSLLFVALLGLSACETYQPIKVKDPQLVAQPDDVSMMLAQAADRASVALETLAAVEQKRTPAAKVAAIPDAPVELRRAMTVNWIGPVDQITKMLADRAGYQFVKLGTEPATPVVVSVAATNEPVIELLRSVGLQLGARADVHVNSADKIVELSYSPVTGLGDVARNRQ